MSPPLLRQEWPETRANLKLRLKPKDLLQKTTIVTNKEEKIWTFYWNSCSSGQSHELLLDSWTVSNMTWHGFWSSTVEVNKMRLCQCFMFQSFTCRFRTMKSSFILVLKSNQELNQTKATKIIWAGFKLPKRNNNPVSTI